MLSHFSCVRLFETLWTVAFQAPLFMSIFSRQEYWRRLPCPPPGDLPHTGIEPVSPEALVLQVNSLLLNNWEAPSKSLNFTQFLDQQAVLYPRYLYVYV